MFAIADEDDQTSAFAQVVKEASVGAGLELPVRLGMTIVGR